MTRIRLGLEGNTAVKTMSGIKNNCCINVKVLFEKCPRPIVSAFSN